MDGKRRKEGVNLVIPFVPSADNSNLSADGDDSFISVDSAMPSPFSEVRLLLNVFITAVGCILTSQQGHDAKPLGTVHFQPCGRGLHKDRLVLRTQGRSQEREIHACPLSLSLEHEGCSQ